MIKTAILTALNRQIQHEQGNARAYEAVSLYFGHVNLHALASFMARQAREERAHASRLIRHVTDRGGQVELGALPSPRCEFASPLEAANAVRDLERATTETIHRLYELARKEGDHALEVSLHWFIREQVEEEQWSTELATLMQQLNEDRGHLFALDREWGDRFNG